MKVWIRKGVWETNSSSVHSLVVAGTPGKSKLRVRKDGYIHVSPGHFGRNLEFFWEQYDKLQYLVTQCYYLNHYSWEDIEDNYHFQHISEAVSEYTGALGVKVDLIPDRYNNDGDAYYDEGYIDHQSVPEYELNLVNEYDNKSIIDFIFNKNIGFKTESD